MSGAIEDQPWINVESSSLTRLKYDRTSLTMLVEFKNGGQYLYQGVGLITFTDLMTASSIGSAFHRLIKTGGFTFQKVG